MHWGFLAIVFVVSVAIGAARSKRLPRDEGGN